MRVFVVTPPEPVVSIDEAKDHLRVDGDGEDALIEGLVAAATGHIDGPNGWLGRAIGPADARGPVRSVRRLPAWSVLSRLRCRVRR